MMKWKCSILRLKDMEFFYTNNSWTEVTLLSSTPVDADVYVASTEEKIKKQIEDMNKLAKLIQHLKSVVYYNPFEIVGVEYEGKWYRGKMIEKISIDDKIYTKVKLIDIGEKCYKRLEDLMVLDDDYFMYPPLAVNIKYDGVIPSNMKLWMRPKIYITNSATDIYSIDVRTYNIINNEDNAENKRSKQYLKHLMPDSSIEDTDTICMQGNLKTTKRLNCILISATKKIRRNNITWLITKTSLLLLERDEAEFTNPMEKVNYFMKYKNKILYANFKA